MEEHDDDWKLGDDGDATICPGCGKRNRPGLKYCIICGRSLVDELEDPGPEAFRTIGEAMGRAQRPRPAQRRPPLRAWSVAALVLLGAVVALTWVQTREEPFDIEAWTAAFRAAPTPRPVVATAMATVTAVPTATPRPVPTAVATIAVVVEPTVLAPTATPVPPTPTATPARKVVKKPKPVVVAPRPVLEPEPAEMPTPVDRPRSEATQKPSLGSDLQDATSAYRQAVEVHNQRVDEYNALADDIQRRNAWDDSESSVALRRRLDRSRDAVEAARVQAELLRARMESVRARYR